MHGARQACAQSLRHQPLCGVCARGRHLVDRLKDPPSSCAMYSCTLASVLLYRCDTEVARRFLASLVLDPDAVRSSFFFRPRGLLLRAKVLRDELERPAAFLRRLFGAEAKMIDGARPAPVPAPRGGCSANSVRRAALRTSTTPRRRDTAGHSCERAASDIHQAYQATSSIKVDAKTAPRANDATCAQIHAVNGTARRWREDHDHFDLGTGRDGRRDDDALERRLGLRLLKERLRRRVVRGNRVI